VVSRRNPLALPQDVRAEIDAYNTRIQGDFVDDITSAAGRLLRSLGF